jgi:hypothetical protein
MFASPVFDGIGPGIYLLVGGVFFAVFSIGTLVIESLALWLLKWASFGRSLLASFLMNLASTIVGFILLAFSFYVANFYTLFLVEFLLSVLIEGGVLMLMKKGAARQNWIASLVANAASYGFLAVALLVLNLLQ